MILRFPEVVEDKIFDYVKNRGFVKKFIYYVINRNNYQKAVYLANWLEPQVSDATDDLKETALSILADYTNLDYDKMAWIIFRWVKKNIEYIGDDLVWSTYEYWQQADVTLDLRTGDCEDGAVLTYVLCRLAGIPVNRLYLFCGDVLGGGHCWLGYKPMHYPINFVFLDWCFYPDGKSIETREKFWIVKQDVKGDNDNYINMWWCFNEENTYIEVKPTGED